MNSMIAPKEQEKKEDEIVKKTLELMEDLVAISQPKSDYILQHFVVDQHDTIPARKKQALLELQIRMFNIRRSQLMAEKIQYQIDEKLAQMNKLETTNALMEAQDNIRKVEIEELKINLEELDLARIGQLREAETLYQIAMQYPKYTADQYQEDEVNYWMLRLGRQVMLDLKSTGHPGAGNIDAIRMMGVPEKDDFGNWLKSFSHPLNSPHEFASTIINAQIEEAEQRKRLQDIKMYANQEDQAIRETPSGQDNRKFSGKKKGKK